MKKKTFKGNKKENRWCAVAGWAGCMSTNLEKRHFFLFPKEHDRWLAWVRACRRFDLIPKGPEYAHRNCYLCHIHFEEKYYTVSIRARLHPDAIPTRFLELTDKNICLDVGMDPDLQNATPSTSKEENCNSCLQLSKGLINNDSEITGPSTSGTCTKISQQAKILSKNSPIKMKLRLKNIKLKAQVIMLREIIRCLRKGKRYNYRRKAVNAEDANEFETLRKLGSKLLPERFAKLLSAQIDAQIKRNHGRRYGTQFKKFALSLYFLSPRNYRELKKSISLSSVRSLQLLTQTWNIAPGLNDEIFHALAIKLKSLSPMDRHCVLCAEMNLKSHLFYNISQDEIIGFEDYGKKKIIYSSKKCFRYNGT